MGIGVAKGAMVLLHYHPRTYKVLYLVYGNEAVIPLEVRERTIRIGN